ncbi:MULTISPECIES: flagellar basal body-associated protein FliL [Corallincola]|uniref:Flagellar protein FliL n=2 Tax=Corallincola TaxID=1775176 RepID=A0ABY1WKR7_9GAMM|nr:MULTISPECIES: flagellar basal body-associated protein FliL [Corallincola]TAA40311.1 flagellar basal body-associated protein FliL [Corallincola spongiicola]TCI05382.1 flagellar basal body-associated protein FliL [Corallincola luteus]
MAEDLELELDDSEGKKKPVMLIIIAVVVVLLGAGAAFYFLSGGDDAQPVADESAPAAEGAQPAASGEDATTGNALYVALPRPFVFNVPGQGRDRLVQIKVQLLVRGGNNESLAKKHIPMIEGTLLKTFSGANADELSTLEGKERLREQALTDIKSALQGLEGTEVVEQVLFTGFVMQ